MATMPQNSVALNGEVVKERRERLLLTQKELADELGINANTLSLIEAKPDYRTSFRTLRDLAKRFTCDPAELVREPERESA